MKKDIKLVQKPKINQKACYEHYIIGIEMTDGNRRLRHAFPYKHEVGGSLDQLSIAIGRVIAHAFPVTKCSYTITSFNLTSESIYNNWKEMVRVQSNEKNDEAQDGKK